MTEKQFRKEVKEAISERSGDLFINFYKYIQQKTGGASVHDMDLLSALFVLWKQQKNLKIETEGN